MYWLSLSHIFGKLLAAENVEMKMLYRLASVLADICNNAVTVSKSELSCYLGNYSENVSNGCGILLCKLVKRGNMCLGDNKAVYGCLRRDVEECKADLILVNLIRGNISAGNSAKNTIHINTPFFFYSSIDKEKIQ